MKPYLSSRTISSHVITTFIILILCLSFPYNAFAQGDLIPEWVKKESSPLTHGNSEAWAIGSDNEGNLFWGVNKDMPGFFKLMDALVYKLDSDGNTLWDVTGFSDTFAQQSYNLKVTDSLVYLGGRTCKSLGTANCDVLFFASDTQDGATEWDFIWDAGYGYEEIDGIVLEEDGIYLTGWSAGDGTQIDVLLMKLDYDRNIIWETTWGSSGSRDDHQDGHIVIDESAIYISGLYDGSPLLGWNGRALLAKFDKTTGEHIADIKYGRQDSWVNAENALGMTTDGEFLYTVGYTTTSLNNWDLFVAKFDKDLNEIWYQTWGGPSDAESSRAITVDEDGSIYIGATTESYGNGEQDIVLLKFNNDGELQWYKTWGGTNNDHTLDIHLKEDKLYLTGKTSSFHPHNKWEAILLKIDLPEANLSIDDNNGNNLGLTIYPNPARHRATLKFNNNLNNSFYFKCFQPAWRTSLFRKQYYWKSIHFK